MGPVVGSNTDKVSDKAGGPTYLPAVQSTSINIHGIIPRARHNISPNHNHLSRRGCPPLYVLAAGRLDGNTGEETYQHLIWVSLVQYLCKGLGIGNEAAVQKTGRNAEKCSPDCGLAAAFVGFVGCSGEVVFDPSTPAVAVAETDQLDSVSFATPEGVEHNGDGVRKASLMVPRWSADYACHKWWWWSR
ncbi:unnamed protein product [Fusarium graminearum]|nr:unnamed protein product [Fusarium graminearum]CAG1974348.1 unnamed protein product [Fusarium graminearum]